MKPATSDEPTELTSGKRTNRFRLPVTLLVLWALIVAAVPVSCLLSQSGWDVTAYRTAIRSLRAGHDPYLDAMAVQKRYYSQPVQPAGDPPFGYIYSPITIPVLRAIGAIPVWLSGLAYGALYVLGILAAIWVAMLAVEANERKFFLYLAPVTIFFPGLLANGTVLGGNIAYILYGLVLLTAVLGWRKNVWIWFYLAVLLASCVKAPMLSLVVVPVLSSRRQWIPTALATGAGIALFAFTPIISPGLFKHYLQAIDLQLSLNRDFGCSPAGLLSDVLIRHGIPYVGASIMLYLAYAIPVFIMLLHLSRQFLKGAFTFKQWMPVLLTGVLLLNPRLIEYDLAAVTLPLALVAWRSLSTVTTSRRALTWLALAFVVANGLALHSWILWKLTECPFLVICFTAGYWSLQKECFVPGLEQQFAQA